MAPDPANLFYGWKKYTGLDNREVINILDYMLEHLCILVYLQQVSKNHRDAENQQGSSLENPSETERRALSNEVMIQSDLTSDSKSSTEMLEPSSVGSNKSGIFFEAIGVAQLITRGSAEIAVTGQFTPAVGF